MLETATAQTVLGGKVAAKLGCFRSMILIGAHVPFKPRMK